MRIIATILIIIFAGLIARPVLFAAHPAQTKVMSCCAKHGKGMSKHCPMQKQGKGCCDGGNCNPVCSQCPACGFSAITAIPYTISHPDAFIAFKEKHISRNWSLTSSYHSELLRPPQMV